MFQLPLACELTLKIECYKGIQILWDILQLDSYGEELASAFKIALFLELGSLDPTFDKQWFAQSITKSQSHLQDCHYGLVMGHTTPIGILPMKVAARSSSVMVPASSCSKIQNHHATQMMIIHKQMEYLNSY